MGAETVGLLVVIGVIVAVLALYLITIGFALTRLNRTLGSVVDGLVIIRDRTMPVGAVLGDIVTDVDAIEVNLDALLNAVGGAPSAPAVSSMGDAVAQARGAKERPAKTAATPAPAPADMEEAVARAREAAPATDDEEEFDLAVAGVAAEVRPPGPPTVSPAVRATTRTPRPVGHAPRPRPKKRSKRSRIPVLESTAPASGSSGRSAGRRKQLAIGSGAAPAPTAASARARGNGAGNGAGSSSMKEAVARAREKAGVR